MIFNGFPNDSSHFITIKLDDWLCDLNFCYLHKIL
jgi:hypothetical protein